MVWYFPVINKCGLQMQIKHPTSKAFAKDPLRVTFFKSLQWWWASHHVPPIKENQQSINSYENHKWQHQIIV